MSKQPGFINQPKKNPKSKIFLGCACSKHLCLYLLNFFCLFVFVQGATLISGRARLVSNTNPLLCFIFCALLKCFFCFYIDSEITQGSYTLSIKRCQEKPHGSRCEWGAQSPSLNVVGMGWAEKTTRVLQAWLLAPVQVVLFVSSAPAFPKPAEAPGACRLGGELCSQSSTAEIRVWVTAKLGSRGLCLSKALMQSWNHLLKDYIDVTGSGNCFFTAGIIHAGGCLEHRRGLRPM